MDRGYFNIWRDTADKNRHDDAYYRQCHYPTPEFTTSVILRGLVITAGLNGNFGGNYTFRIVVLAVTYRCCLIVNIMNILPHIAKKINFTFPKIRIMFEK